MSSSGTGPGGVVGPALGKGCLAGLGLLVLFVVISGLIYLVLGAFALADNIRLLVSIASGPILGTIIGLLIAWRIMSRTDR